MQIRDVTESLYVNGIYNVKFLTRLLYKYHGLYGSTKANSRTNRNGQILTPCGPETHVRILMMLKIYNYIKADQTCKSTWCCNNVDVLGKRVTCHVSSPHR